MRGRTVLLAAAAVGVGYALWKLPVTQRFVATYKEASARREAELREAVEVAVETDATSRAPRHAAWSETPDLDVEAGWDRKRPGAPAGSGIHARCRRPGSLADARGGAGAAARPHRRASSVGATAPPALPAPAPPPNPTDPPARTGIRCRVPVPGGTSDTRGLIFHGNR